MAAPLSPAENVRRRRLAAEHGPAIEAELRARLPELPLEVEVSAATLPVDEEDVHVYIRTDGTALLRVLGVANDLTRHLGERECVRFVARVWPRTIWCRKSARRQPRERAGPEPPPTEGLLYSERDRRGNTRLCLSGSHAGEHDFGED
ncbi:MAG TPA: hypothetical protein VGL23_23435 [Chloroflexota bacterium]|jgi:hypothetical protein